MKNIDIQHVQNRLDNIAGRIALLQEVFYHPIERLEPSTQTGIEMVLDDIQYDLQDAYTCLDDHKQPDNVHNLPVNGHQVA